MDAELDGLRDADGLMDADAELDGLRDADGLIEAASGLISIMLPAMGPLPEASI